MASTYAKRRGRSREKRIHTHLLKKTMQDLRASPINNFEEIKYVKGGHIEFDPNVGETMVPECIEVEIKNENDLATLALISRLTDKYGVKVKIPEYKQTWGSSKVIRIVIDYNNVCK